MDDNSFVDFVLDDDDDDDDGDGGDTDLCNFNLSFGDEEGDEDGDLFVLLVCDEMEDLHCKEEDDDLWCTVFERDVLGRPLHIFDEVDVLTRFCDVKSLSVFRDEVTFSSGDVDDIVSLSDRTDDVTDECISGAEVASRTLCSERGGDGPAWLEES